MIAETWRGKKQAWVEKPISEAKITTITASSYTDVKPSSLCARYTTTVTTDFFITFLNCMSY